MGLRISSRGIFPAAVLIAVSVVFLLQALGLPNVGSILFIALGLAFVAPYLVGAERRRHMFLLPAGVLVGMGVGLLLPATFAPLAVFPVATFLASLATGLGLVYAVAPDRRWPLIPAAILAALAILQVFGYTALVPELVRPYVVPLLLLAIGLYTLLEPRPGNDRP